MLIKDNSSVRKNYFNSNIIKKENEKKLQHFQMDSFDADATRS